MDLAGSPLQRAFSGFSRGIHPPAGFGWYSYFCKYPNEGVLPVVWEEVPNIPFFQKHRWVILTTSVVAAAAVFFVSQKGGSDNSSVDGGSDIPADQSSSVGFTW
jgi:hypothetical protein